jgi:hypothetical protein
LCRPADPAALVVQRAKTRSHAQTMIVAHERMCCVMTSLVPRRGRQLTEQRRGARGIADPLTHLQNRMGELIQSFFTDPFLAAPLAPVVAPMWVSAFDIEENQDSQPQARRIEVKAGAEAGGGGGTAGSQTRVTPGTEPQAKK